jgi:hypothetical protein
MAISYQVIAGNLPEGAILVSDGTLTGVLSFDLPESPTWVTTSDSVTLDEGDEYSRTFTVNPNSGTSSSINRIIIYSGTIPWGLQLNSGTGVLSGTIGNLIATTSEDSKSPKPTWNTASGTLGTFNEYDTITPINLSATANLGTTVDKFYLLSGTLPWGLELINDTGEINGTVQNIIPAVIAADPKTPTPTWNTPIGTLGTFDEYETITTIALSVTPHLGTVIERYFLVDTELPWGLTLDSTNGEITGTVTELTPSIANYEPAEPPPTWNTSSGSLGSVNEGDAFSTTLSASPSSGNTLGTYYLVEDALPWGLFLDPITGDITGTAYDVDTTIEYTFTIRVVDSGKGFADREFSITVTNL